MRYKSLFITILAIAMVAALAATALAGKPENPGKPTTTTTTAPDYWTCQARNDNGAIWPLGEYSEATGVYTGEGPLLCVDVIPEHREVTNWSVEWSGTTAKGTIKGLKLVFEEEVHETVFVETISYSTTGCWTASLPSPVENLVFVAMPHNGDKWIGPMTFTIKPSGDCDRSVRETDPLMIR